MLATRVEEKLAQEQHVVSMVTDDAKQKQLQLDDEEEDFLDEGTISLVFKIETIAILNCVFNFSKRKYQWKRLPHGSETDCLPIAA